MRADIPLFKGKTDNILWRKFRTVMLEKTEDQINSEVKNADIAKSIIDHKRRSIKKIKEDEN